MGKFSTTLDSTAFAAGQLVRVPPGRGNGYWAGAPGVFHDPKDGGFYLTYRLRRPRGVAPDRGGEVRIARSSDGHQFQDIWRMTKDQVNTASIERCSLWRGDDGQWRYFASYVDAADGRWCVSMLKADSLSQLEPAGMKRLFSASDFKIEGVKDPWIIRLDGVYHMFLSVALSTAQTGGDSHSSLDIFNTGECLSASALATSRNLDDWEWQGVTLKPQGNAWDRYCRRINSILPVKGKYLAFYDGSAGHHENYEERTGLAVSTDLKKWQVLTPDGPHFTSLHATGSLRYLDAQTDGNQLLLYYELASADGSHDLRVISVTADAFAL